MAMRDRNQKGPEGITPNIMFEGVSLTLTPKNKGQSTTSATPAPAAVGTAAAAAAAAAEATAVGAAAATAAEADTSRGFRICSVGCEPAIGPISHQGHLRMRARKKMFADCMNLNDKIAFRSCVMDRMVKISRLSS